MAHRHRRFRSVSLTALLASTALMVGPAHAKKPYVSLPPIDLGTLQPNNAGNSSIEIGPYVSDDGSVIAGQSDASPPSSTDQHGFRYTKGGLEEIGAFGTGNTNVVFAISGNGSTVIGEAYTGQQEQPPPNGGLEPVRHAYSYKAGILTDLTGGAAFDKLSSAAYAVSTDGTTIVGGFEINQTYTTNTTHYLGHAFIYNTTGLHDIHSDAALGNTSTARAVSGDGSVVAGTSAFSNTTNVPGVWRYANNAFTNLNVDTVVVPNFTPSEQSNLFSVTKLFMSRDGNVIAGEAHNSANDIIPSPAATHGFVWRNGVGVVDIGGLGPSGLGASPTTLVYALSADGSTLVGQSSSASGSQHAYAYNVATATMKDLGTFDGTGSSSAKAVSADGSVIVGEVNYTVNSKLLIRAFRYTDGVMTNLGTLGGDQSYATSVSADGRAIVGYSQLAGNQIRHAWVFYQQMVDITDTGTSISKVYDNTRAYIDLRQAALANAASYDCRIFGPNNLCVSFGGRYALLTEKFSEGAGVLVAAARVTDELRVGTFVDYGGVTKRPSGFKVADETPTLGLFAGYSERPDDLGWQAKLVGALHLEKLTITRPAFEHTEAGSGKALAASWLLNGEIGYGIAAGDSLRVTPYLGLRHTSVRRGAYTEATTTDVTLPFSYAPYGQVLTTGIVGAKFDYAVAKDVVLRASIGGEFDIAHRTDSFDATSQVPGLTSLSIPGTTGFRAARPFATLGLTYDIDSTRRFTTDFSIRGQANSSRPSVTALATYQMAF